MHRIFFCHLLYCFYILRSMNDRYLRPVQMKYLRNIIRNTACNCNDHIRTRIDKTPQKRHEYPITPIVILLKKDREGYPDTKDESCLRSRAHSSKKRNNVCVL